MWYIYMHHYIKQQIFVLGSSFFLCSDFDYFFLVHSCESILVGDWVGFKRSVYYFWTCLGTFCIFLPFWWLENQPQHQNKSSLSAFQWTLSFWNLSNFSVYSCFNLEVSKMISVFKIGESWQHHIFNSLNAGWISNHMVGIPTT